MWGRQTHRRGLGEAQDPEWVCLVTVSLFHRQERQKQDSRKCDARTPPAEQFSAILAEWSEWRSITLIVLKEQ